MTTKLIYTLYNDKQQTSYRHIRIVVQSAEIETIESLIAGCVDNAVGYQSQDTADRMLRGYAALRADGVTHVVGYRGSMYLGLNFQVYAEQPLSYCCEPRIDLPGHMSEIGISYKLLQKLAKRVGRDNARPEQWIDALRAMGATWVHSKQAPERFGPELCIVKPYLEDPIRDSWSEILKPAAESSEVAPCSN